MIAASSAMAQGSAWDVRWDGVLYGYAERMHLRADSILNPDNQVVELPERSETLEGRFNWKVRSDSVRLALRPIFLGRRVSGGVDEEIHYSGYLSRWQLSLEPVDGLEISAGRIMLHWGPSQFRSPSSFFYFDAGRSNPLLELSGMDTFVTDWRPYDGTTLTLAHVFGAGHEAQSPDPWEDSWLLKLDRLGLDWAAGLVAMHVPGQEYLVGVYGQTTVNEALLLYGELGSSTRPDALRLSKTAAFPMRLEEESPRRANALLGFTYTFENGNSVFAEYLYHGHGFNEEQGRSLFDQVADGGLAMAGLALSGAPPLLGRHYLHLVAQSNLMADAGYWRLMWTHSFTDGGSELAGYGEFHLNDRVTALAVGVLPIGGAQREFSALYSSSIILGLRVSLP